MYSKATWFPQRPTTVLSGLYFGPSSVALTVQDLVQWKTKCSQELLMAVWSLLLSLKQEFLKNHLTGVPVTPNQQGTMDMQYQVLSSVGAQKMNSIGYQVTNLEAIEFHWEHFDLNIDAVWQPGIETPFSPPTSNKFEMGSIAENLILVDEDQHKGKSRPPPTFQISERPTHPPVLRRSHLFETRNANVPDFNYRNLIE